MVSDRERSRSYESPARYRFRSPSPHLHGRASFPGSVRQNILGDPFKHLAKRPAAEEVGQGQLVAPEVGQRGDVLIRHRDAARRDASRLCQRSTENIIHRYQQALHVVHAVL